MPENLRAPLEMCGGGTMDENQVENRLTQWLDAPTEVTKTTAMALVFSGVLCPAEGGFELTAKGVGIAAYLRAIRGATA